MSDKVVGLTGLRDCAQALVLEDASFLDYCVSCEVIALN